MGLYYHSFLFSGRPEFCPQGWRGLERLRELASHEAGHNLARKGLFVRLVWLFAFRGFTWIREEKRIAQGRFVKAVLALFG